jgi:hypothetical protein
MLHFHLWCNLKGGQDETRFAESAQEFLSYLHAREFIEGYAITCRQFVIAPPDLGKFHLIVDFKDLEQVNRAFALMNERPEDMEGYYQPAAEAVLTLSTALYKDFPEPRRPHRILPESDRD